MGWVWVWWSNQISRMMSEIEIEEEKGYRHFERLGILAGDGKPTLSQEFMAQEEADEWERRYRSAKPEDREP